MAETYGLRSFGVPPTKIIDNIWLGNYIDGENTQFLIDNRIDVVINCVGQLPHQWKVGTGYYLFPCGYNTEFNTNNVAQKAVDMIHRLRDVRWPIIDGILVHCWEGIDRSPTVLWKYLTNNNTNNRRMNDAEAEEYIKSKRPIAVIHPEWWK